MHFNRVSRVFISSILLLAGCGPSEPSPQQITRVDSVLKTYLKPIKLENCELVRIGDKKHDGGYLACKDLGPKPEAAYSYGIGGTDAWGCEISSIYNINVFQYDPFDTSVPACATNKTHFFAEGIAGIQNKDKAGRAFDTLEAHLTRNGHNGKNLLLKMDVEGAEWDSLAKASEETLQHFGQIFIEMHWLYDETHFDNIQTVLKKLNDLFYVVHVHANNHACKSDRLFPADVLEVTFVNKRFAKAVEPHVVAELPNLLDSPMNRDKSDCPMSKGIFE